MLEISDEGPGISIEDQEKIFRPFCRITRDAHLNPNSNGLGLSICKNLSNKMGGDIEVLSDGKSGSTFRFSMLLGQVMEADENMSNTERKE